MFVREVYGLLSKTYTETFRNYHNKMYDLAKQSKDSNRHFYQRICQKVHENLIIIKCH